MTDQATREAAADLIERAMDILREGGWCQRAMRDEAGRRCMEGALRAARIGTPIMVARLAVDTVKWECAAPIPIFNDYPTTTAEDALLTMKRAVASLREVTA